MNYARAVALAVRLITANGRELKVQRLSSTPANTAKPWEGPVAPSVAEELTLTGVFLSPEGGWGKEFVSEDLVKRCDQVCMLPGGSYDLADYTVIEDEGTKWRIEWMRELKPGDTTVLYALGVKR